MEIESFKLLVDRIRAVDLFDRAVDLQVVVVNDHNEVVQLLGSREHGSFPYLAFFDLAVAQQCINTEVFVVQLAAQCHTAGSGNALAERTGAHVQSGQVLHGRMALQAGADLTQCLEFFYRKIASVRHGGIQTGRCMALGKNKAVSVRILGILRIDVHFLKIEISKNVCR